MIITVREVVNALGGTYKTAAATGVVAPAVSMWLKRGLIPPAHYITIRDELLDRCLYVTPDVFSFARKPDPQPAQPV